MGRFNEPSAATHKTTNLAGGWSDKVFDIMKLVETDKQALVRTIEAVEL